MYFTPFLTCQIKQEDTSQIFIYFYSSKQYMLFLFYFSCILIIHSLFLLILLVTKQIISKKNSLFGMICFVHAPL